MPSFKVSFSDDEVIQPEPQLSLKTESLTSDIRMTLTSDQSLVQKRPSAEDYEAPYMISSDGTKLLLDIKSSNSYLTQFDISYTKVFVCDAEWNKLGEFSFSHNNETEFTGECGLYTAYQYFADINESANIISRFNIGEFEIVPKREQLLGDADGDGKVTISDVTAIRRYLAEMDAPEGIGKTIA